ncbi:hypothetical protein ZWY2020_000846 [Hordeum vulgare]|nr:hypothetical protein ZWY2020_000846 [Hordeum vulgare]
MGIKPSSLRSPRSSPATEGCGTTVLLPHDVVFDILSWVPVKSVCRFKSVCRDWRDLISDPAFVAAHRARGEPLLAIAANSCSERSAVRLTDMDGNIIKVVEYTGSILRFFCSNPGNLICVVGYGLGKATVLNLATGETIVVCHKDQFMGFGRAAPSGIYKMVCISPRTCAILTVGDGVGWRQTQPLPRYSTTSISYSSRPVEVRGVMYFMLHPQLNGDSVICFDLESEEWKGTIKGPPEPDIQVQLHRGWTDNTLRELNGALCMLQPKVGKMSIWLLVDSRRKGEGVWIKVYSIPVDPSAYSPIMPLRILPDNGKLLLYNTLKFEEFGVLQIYDPRNRTFTDTHKMLSADNAGCVALCSLHLDTFLPAKVD